MKISKKDRSELETVLSDLKRGRDFIMHPQTAIMRMTSMTSADTFSSTYYLDERYFKIDKEIGSLWTVALSAIHRLEKLLNEEA